jgi:hypothetical protein
MKLDKLGGWVFVTVCALALLMSACGPPPVTAKLANVTAGSMPSEATWDGVYFSPLFGYLHVKQSGQLLTAKWERPRKDKWGEMQGNLDGNLLRFDWKEYTAGLVGPNSRRVGKGYLVYKRPEGENVDDFIEGEAGLRDNEVGIPWRAIKQRNVKADLDSIGGTGSSDIGGGDWDGKNLETGDVEPPAAPEGEAEDEAGPEGEAADTSAEPDAESMK